MLSSPSASISGEVPLAGQVSGSITEVLSAAEVVHLLVRGAEESLLRIQGSFAAAAAA
jgi:hypothetical protein